MVSQPSQRWRISINGFATTSYAFNNFL
ncbi:hypothetical protein O9929_11865 [Vibrio lentus]|nr:hypothetical protein [Vibrio lentus]